MITKEVKCDSPEHVTVRYIGEAAEDIRTWSDLILVQCRVKISRLSKIQKNERQITLMFIC